MKRSWRTQHKQLKTQSRNLRTHGDDTRSTIKAGRKGDEVNPVPLGGMCTVKHQPWGPQCMILWMGDDVNPSSCL